MSLSYNSLILVLYKMFCKYHKIFFFFFHSFFKSITYTSDDGAAETLLYFFPRVIIHIAPESFHIIQPKLYVYFFDYYYHYATSTCIQNKMCIFRIYRVYGRGKFIYNPRKRNIYT